MSECHHILTFFLSFSALAANLSLKRTLYSIGTDYDRGVSIENIFIKDIVKHKSNKNGKSEH
jgi:hypothetical protein